MMRKEECSRENQKSINDIKYDVNNGTLHWCDLCR